MRREAARGRHIHHVRAKRQERHVRALDSRVAYGYAVRRQSLHPSR